MFCGYESTYFVDHTVKIRAISDLQTKNSQETETIIDQDPISSERLCDLRLIIKYLKCYFLKAKETQHKLNETYYCLFQVNTKNSP